MRIFGVVVAVAVTLSSVLVVQAQNLASVGGPRELPPASYTGQQYIDSRGCVFLKAGYGGQTTWVPRVNAQREALCGFPPTFGRVRTAAAEPAPAPRPVAQAPAAPAPPPRTAAIDPATYAPAPYTPPTSQPARRTARQAPAAPAQTATQPASPAPAPASRVTAPAPYVQTAPRRTYEAAASGPGPGQIGCFISAPVAEVVRLRNGGTAVVCTTGDGSLSGWRAPIYPAGSRVGAALTDPVARLATAPTPAAAPPGTRTEPMARASAPALPVPPKGYKLAWEDDRLNPNRGQGTAAGQAAQDQVWTRDVPARLVAEQPRKTARVTVSSKSAPVQAAPQPGSKGALVQVGTFGVASNAEGAAARLAGLGLPVSKGRITKGGKTLQIVFAGPFASTGDAQSALSAARRAGFPDAFVR